MKILITGGCGFIGHHLAQHLIKNDENHEITVMDNFKRGNSKENADILKKKNIKIIHGDIRSKEDYPKDNYELVIDCAAEPSVLEGYNNPCYVINNNLIGGIETLEWCRRNERKTKLIFLSTSRVYALEALRGLKLSERDKRLESKVLIDENFPTTGARSLYGTTKLATEMLIQEYSESFNLEYIINRCGLIAGGRQDGKSDQGVVAFWVKNHIERKNIKYIGSFRGKQVRDVLNVKDLCNLINLQVDNWSKFEGKVFNVGGGPENSVSLLELTEICRKVTGYEARVEWDETNRKGDIPFYITNNKKILSACSVVGNWKAKTNVEQTIQEIYKSLKNESNRRN